MPQDHNSNHDGDDDFEDRMTSFFVIKNMGGGNRDGNGGDGGGVNDPNGASSGNQGGEREDIPTGSGEFTLVNSRNIGVKKFSGEPGCKVSCMNVNENQRDLVSIKGKHGDIWNEILTWAERRSDKTRTRKYLDQSEVAMPLFWKHYRVVHAASKNWTESGANKLVKCGANGGIDAWRRLCAEYIPLSQTKKDIIFSEILETKPVNDNGVFKLLNRMEELQYTYNQCGGQPLGNNIMKRLLATRIFTNILKPFALHLDTAL